MDTADKNSDEYYRSQNGYKAFKDRWKGRATTILAGSNGGMLHAFNNVDGSEKFDVAEGASVLLWTIALDCSAAETGTANFDGLLSPDGCGGGGAEDAEGGGAGEFPLPSRLVRLRTFS